METLDVTLSPAEARVVAVLSTGVEGERNSHAIAKALHLSHRTVKAHIESAMRKSGTNDRVSLVLWYRERIRPRRLVTCPRCQMVFSDASKGFISDAD